MVADGLPLDDLDRARKGVRIPRVVGVRREALCRTVVTHDVANAINCPLTIHQHRPGTAACRRAGHVGASITAGSEEPILNNSVAASGGTGNGLDVVAAHHGSGGRGRRCPDGDSGEGGGYGKTPCDVHRLENSALFILPSGEKPTNGVKKPLLMEEVITRDRPDKLARYFPLAPMVSLPTGWEDRHGVCDRGAGNDGIGGN